MERSARYAGSCPIPTVLDAKKRLLDIAHEVNADLHWKQSTEQSAKCVGSYPSCTIPTVLDVKKRLLDITHEVNADLHWKQSTERLAKCVGILLAQFLTPHTVKK